MAMSGPTPFRSVASPLRLRDLSKAKLKVTSSKTDKLDVSIGVTWI